MVATSVGVSRAVGRQEAQREMREKDRGALPVELWDTIGEPVERRDKLVPTPRAIRRRPARVEWLSAIWIPPGRGLSISSAPERSIPRW